MHSRKAVIRDQTKAATLREGVYGAWVKPSDVVDIVNCVPMHRCHPYVVSVLWIESRDNDLAVSREAFAGVTQHPTDVVDVLDKLTHNNHVEVLIQWTETQVMQFYIASPRLKLDYVILKNIDP